MHRPCQLFSATAGLLLSLLLLLLSESSLATASILDAPVAPLPERIEAFEQWLAEGGAVLRGVAVGSGAQVKGGGLGLVATSSLADRTVIASLPLSMLLSVEHMFEDPWAQEHLDHLSDTEATALYLARMRVLGSDAEHNAGWAPYVSLLPERFANFPLFYTDAQMELLQSSMVRKFTERRLARARSTYASLDQSVKDVLAFEDLLWGLSALWSRSHSVRIRDGQGKWVKAPAFVPVADLINMPSGSVRASSASSSSRSSSAAVPWMPQRANAECATNEASTAFECFVTTNVAAGKEILVPYGTGANQDGTSSLGNGQLLLDYGVAVEHNGFDIVQIEVAPLRRAGRGHRRPAGADGAPGEPAVISKSLRRMQKELVRAVTRRDGTEAQAFQLHVPSPSADGSNDGAIDLASVLPPGLMQWQRIVSLDDALFAAFGGVARRDALLGRLQTDLPLGPEFEHVAVGMLAERLVELLREYGTSVEEDVAELDALDEQMNSRGEDAGESAESVVATSLDQSIRRSCLLLRIGEKRILHAHLAMLNRYGMQLRAQIAERKAEQMEREQMERIQSNIELERDL